MTSRAKKISQVFASRSENPHIEAMALYDQYKVIYGPNPILDQAIRTVRHSIKTNWSDEQFTQKTFDSVRLTDVVDAACTRVSNLEDATKEAKDKAKLVRNIHMHLYDCLG